MKNKFFALAPFSLLLFVALGCSFIGGSENTAKTDPKNANKTMTDKAVDTVVGQNKTGVVECDEVFDMIESEMNNPDDDFVTKAAKGIFLNRIKDGLKSQIEEDQKNSNSPEKKAEMAKTCKEIKEQIVKYKTEHKGSGPANPSGISSNTKP